MERTVPSTESEEVDLYIRTYYSLLRSTAEVQIRTLEEVHTGIKSLLHTGVRDHSPDMSAFLYTLLRLPQVMPEVRLVVLGQTTQTFHKAGYADFERWEEVCGLARRRRCYYDGGDTLACFIASRTDIDDIIPMLTTFQIEWNKLHRLAGGLPPRYFEGTPATDQPELQEIADTLELSLEDLGRWMSVWGEDFWPNLAIVRERASRLAVRLLSGSYRDYKRATRTWLENIEAACPQLRERPIYFISSNTHSLLNLLTGFAIQNQAKLVGYLERPENRPLFKEWQQIQTQRVPASRENFLYYTLKKYTQDAKADGAQALLDQQGALETSLGTVRVPSRHSFDVEAQVVELGQLQPDLFDPRLRQSFFGKGGSKRDGFLKDSNALILNIDYPLGLAAYNILSEVAETAGAVLGVYIMGKCASLNAVVGDVLIPNVVHDEHSQNSYLFPNCITAADVAPYLVFGTVLDNQKAVSVQGTFLQNERYMDVFYREGYTDIEMESGPYLSAIYEMYRPKRHPVNEIVNLYGIPFDLGVVHYASDTPLSKGKNLGAGSLSYFGMESTYAAMVAILRRIFALEKQRLKDNR